MKTIHSPNLRDGEAGIYVKLWDAPRRAFARGGLVDAARKVRGAGRFGDDMLIHINRDEFEQLRRAWGEPHYNPETGLPEYFDWGSIASDIGDAYGGDWGSLVGGLASGVVGALGNKAQIDQANRNLPPAPDTNLTRPLGHFTDARTYTPPKMEDPSAYYTYGQKGGEPNLFKHNGLDAITGAIPPPNVGPKQPVPSNSQIIGTGLVGGVLNWALKNPNLISHLFNQGLSQPQIQNAIQQMAAPDMQPAINAGTQAGQTAFSGADAGAGALPAATTAYENDLAGSRIGSVVASDLSPEEEAALNAGAAPVAADTAATAADTAGTGALAADTTATSGDLLQGSIAGADMTDTAAYTPAALDATTGAGSVLGGIAAGGGAFGAFNVLANYLMQNGSMSPADYERLWNDQSASLKNQIAAETDPTKKAQLESNLADTQATLTMAKDNLSGGGGRANTGILPERQFRRGGRVQRFAVGGPVMPGGALNTPPQFGAPAMSQAQPQFGTPPGVGVGAAPVQIGVPSNLARPAPNNMGAPPVPGAPIPRQPMPIGAPPNLMGAPATRNMPPMGMPPRAFPPNMGRPAMPPPNMRRPMPMPAQNMGRAPMPIMRQPMAYPGMGARFAVGGPVSTAFAPTSDPSLGSIDGPYNTMDPNNRLRLMAGQAADLRKRAMMTRNPTQRADLNTAADMSAARMSQFMQQTPPPAPQGFAVGGMALGRRMGVPSMGPKKPWTPGRSAGLRIPGLSPPRLGGGFTAPRMAQPPQLSQLGVYADGGHVRGPGTGRSDSIPASLSSGEYVLDAESVGLLGDGSTEAGAAKLDAMRKNLRQHKGRALAKGKFSPTAKSPLDYMTE